MACVSCEPSGDVNHICLFIISSLSSLGEYFGCSRFMRFSHSGAGPKTSLGALCDGARLTPEQFAKLNKICK